MNLYKNILVCVTKQKNCERLIEAASKHCLEQGNLHVLHVAKIHGIFLIIQAKVKS